MKKGDIWQGDVRLVPVEGTPPATAKLVKSIVLAEGEITGHMHTLSADQGVLLWDDLIWVVGEEAGALSHPEHDPSPVKVVEPEQAYQVVIQQERTLAGSWQPVQD